ncbi:hypothetical protein NIES4103_35210 [Nostoc sp. NIES-4103]|nr:hypothetical protein NIES4103_35210 [Nostoc sp. NIES-4103]
MKCKDSYHGWLIELIPMPEGYMFKCWMSDGQIGISNYHIYPSLYQAIKAGRKRAKLESTSLALIHFLNESFKNCNLNLAEHVALVSSILDFTNSASKPQIIDSIDLADG